MDFAMVPSGLSAAGYSSGNVQVACLRAVFSGITNPLMARK